MKLQFPFSGVVGQERMRTALLVAAVDPTIGGVLIRGHKGTAKTTAVRGFAGVLPDIEVLEGDPYNADPDSPSDASDERKRSVPQGKRVTRHVPYVELPLGATEDRVIGSLHIEAALSEGRREFEPGLLARANRGVLYVDEVNLLDDYLVDVLLDAAASGVNTVEREGISLTHPSRFVLVGTMNPEEGELRPQFLDRFALCVTVSGLVDAEARLKVAKRRVAFEADPEAFLDRWKPEDEAIRCAVAAARNRLDAVAVPDDMWRLAVEISVATGSEGHRADIAVVKSARALAALTESDLVTAEHIREMARLVFPHRMARSGVETPETAVDRLEELLTGGELPAGSERHHERTDGRTGGEESRTEDWDPLDAAEQIQVPGAAASGSMLFDFLKKKLRSKT